MKKRKELLKRVLPLLAGVGVVGIFLVFAFEQKTRSLFTKSRVAPYPFQVSNPIDLSNQIARLETQVSRDPSAALDRAALASTYVIKAKITGDTSLYDKAEQMAKASLKSLPFSNTSAKLTLATVAEARHRFTEAIRLAEEVQKEGKRTEGLSILVTAYMALGDSVAASRYADKLANLRPTMGSLALRALVLSSQGRDEEAEFGFIRAIALEDVGEMQDSAWVRCLFGRFLLGRGRAREASDLFRESLKIVPNYHFALSLLGEAELSRGNYKAAEKHFMEAFTSSRQLVYLKSTAAALTLQGKKENAAEVLKQVEALMREELNGKEYGHRIELAHLLVEKGTDEATAEAIQLATEESKTRSNSQTLFVLAAALEKGKRWEEARETMQSILRTGVRDSRYYRLASRIENALSNQRGAELYRNLAQSLNSDSRFDTAKNAFLN